jgi:hypothetical protein
MWGAYLILAIGLMAVVGWRSWAAFNARKNPSPAEREKARQRFERERADQRQQYWQRQLKELVFPYELVAGAQAEAAYEAARARGQAEGYTPLIITPGTRMLPDLPREPLILEARRVIEAVPQANEFFAQRMTELSKYDEGDTMKRRLDEVEAELFAAAAPIGPTPYVDNRMSTLVEHFGSKPPFPYISEAAVVRIPTARPWEIPAYLLYGGWNGCPHPEQMVAVARHWHEKYGADVCALGSKSLEFRVECPPADLRQTLELMREQMLFCDEGINELLAAPGILEDTAWRLPKQKYWFFWWD